MTGMAIPAVGKLLTDCWAAAELAVRSECNDNDEEFITTLFRLRLSTEVMGCGSRTAFGAGGKCLSNAHLGETIEADHHCSDAFGDHPTNTVERQIPSSLQP